MKLFPHAHATHPDWRVAAALVVAQLQAQMAQPQYANAPALGLVYLTDQLAPQGRHILGHLRQVLPSVGDWTGTVGMGVCGSGVEYFDEPALSVMLCALAPEHFRIFSGLAPIGRVAGFVPHTALVHADGRTPDAGALVAELAQRTTGGQVFGGLTSNRETALQFAVSRGAVAESASGGIFSGGLSGVAFDAGVPLMTRMTQGSKPLGPAHRVTAVDGAIMLRLDDRPALDVLLDDLGSGAELSEAALFRMRQTLVGLSADGVTVVSPTSSFTAGVSTRTIIGVDPVRRGVAIAEHVEPDMHVTFASLELQSARVDLMRICAELRDRFEPEAIDASLVAEFGGASELSAPHPARGMAGAIYISCMGRGGRHFGGPHAELEIIRHALGDVPLTGFFAGGEIARDQIHAHSGVLTVFATSDA